MQHTKLIHWLQQGKHRRLTLMNMSQPMTAVQIACNAGTRQDSCSDAFGELATRGLVRCLNSPARQNRVYWLTDLGVAIQQKIRMAESLDPLQYDLPEVNWPLYGECCYRHRAAVVKAISEPLQPSAIKRKASSQDSKLRMSANNVRDVIRFLRVQGVVEQVEMPKKAHPRYRLTLACLDFRRLLMHANPGGPGWQ